MMRPKPRRAGVRAPFRPVLQVHDEVWGVRGDDDRLVRHPDALLGGVELEHRIEAKHDPYVFARTYGGDAETLRAYFTQSQLYYLYQYPLVDDCIAEVS
jgi:hypothetical protein